MAEYTFDDLSVVMGTYNEAEAIETVLDDIDRVTDGRAEVVCVDGSDDATPAERDVLAALRDVEIARTTPLEALNTLEDLRRQLDE